MLWYALIPPDSFLPPCSCDVQSCQYCAVTLVTFMLCKKHRLLFFCLFLSHFCFFVFQLFDLVWNRKPISAAPRYGTHAKAQTVPCQCGPWQVPGRSLFNLVNLGLGRSLFSSRKKVAGGPWWPPKKVHFGRFNPENHPYLILSFFSQFSFHMVLPSSMRQEGLWRIFRSGVAVSHKAGAVVAMAQQLGQPFCGFLSHRGHQKSFKISKSNWSF